MNALLHTLSVLDLEPKVRTDGDHTVTLNDCNWKIRFEYRIDSHGTPRKTYFDRDGMQEDCGDATEVSIVSATLLSSHHEEVTLPLSMIPGDLISDYETEISQKIDEEEQA